jgi:hypothetical protein
LGSAVRWRLIRDNRPEIVEIDHSGPNPGLDRAFEAGESMIRIDVNNAPLAFGVR